MEQPATKRRKQHNENLETEPTGADYERMSAWLQREGADFANVTIHKSHESEGYGIYAARAIKAGSPVAYLPSHLVLSEHDALASPLGKAFMAYNATITPRDQYAERHVCTKTILWLFMMHEHWVRGPASKWWPYLRALPRQYDTPLYWTADERQWLAGTNLAHVVAEKQRELERDFDAAVAVMGDNGELRVAFAGAWPLEHRTASALSFQRFLWARTACSSRAFPSDLNLVAQGRVKAAASAAAANGDDPVLGADDTHETAGERRADGSVVPCKCHLALWPFFDMLNHRRGQSMTWDAVRRPGGITFVTGADMAEGDEVFNSYGPKGNDELLLSYGFCLDIPSNPDDYYPIKLNFDTDPQRERKLSVLSRHSLLPYKHLYLLRHADPCPGSLIAAMRVLVASASELASLTSQTTDPTAGPVSPRNELTVWDTLAQLLTAKSAAIRDADAPPASPAEAGFRARMATIYRNGQRAILATAVAVTRERTAALVAETPMFALAEVAADEAFFADPRIESLAERVVALADADEDVDDDEEGPSPGWDLEDWAVVYILYAKQQQERFSLVGAETGSGAGELDEDTQAGLQRLASVLCAEDSPFAVSESDLTATYVWLQSRRVTIRSVKLGSDESDDDEEDEDEDDDEPTVVFVLV
ncbi:hypothetical protein BC828DRAFT_401605 [Blastocladiella britannica]|nr:hypothetical protein BC828DRAFT_401605 [Blastocladiella britannica]